MFFRIGIKNERESEKNSGLPTGLCLTKKLFLPLVKNVIIAFEG